MCVCIYIPEGKTISEERLRQSYRANPDGCGVMWQSSRCNWLLSENGVWTEDAFINSFISFRLQYPNSEFAIHLRTASSSNISYDQCHPFYISENLAFMHNGNLFEFMGGKESDTKRFNTEVLKRLPGNFLDNPDIMNALEKYCAESMSKMVFMKGGRTARIVNEAAGYWDDGVWYSNGGIDDYSGYGYSGAYEYHEGEIRHKGGLVSIQMFEEEDRLNWSQCERCLGWYKTVNMYGEVCEGCNTLEELEKWMK